MKLYASNYFLSSYFLHNSTEISFNNSGNSWTILSPIEQSIKNKIEAVGTPLKDWDIQINCGIITGCNEAFIITTAKRDEILANCKTEIEREKTADLIRPILRGRDIKRYSYEWADLWLIVTFPARHYDIEEYPAVKNYLLSFGIEKLEQSGKEYLVDGKVVKSRKKTNNSWFEVQDSIGYWEDFSRLKICWARLMRLSKSEINNFPRFCLVSEKYYIQDSCCFICGNDLNIILNMLNSIYASYYFFKNVAVLDNGGMQMRQQYVENILLPKVSNTSDANIDNKIFQMFNFTDKEIIYLKNYVEKYELSIIN